MKMLRGNVEAFIIRNPRRKRYRIQIVLKFEERNVEFPIDKKRFQGLLNAAEEWEKKGYTEAGVWEEL